eukprot:tig00000492_g1448.t1
MAIERCMLYLGRQGRLERGLRGLLAEASVGIENHSPCSTLPMRFGKCSKRSCMRSRGGGAPAPPAAAAGGRPQLAAVGLTCRNLPETAGPGAHHHPWCMQLGLEWISELNKWAPNEQPKEVLTNQMLGASMMRKSFRFAKALVGIHPEFLGRKILLKYPDLKLKVIFPTAKIEEDYGDLFSIKQVRAAIRWIRNEWECEVLGAHILEKFPPPVVISNLPLPTIETAFEGQFPPEKIQRAVWWINSKLEAEVLGKQIHQNVPPGGVFVSGATGPKPGGHPRLGVEGLGRRLGRLADQRGEPLLDGTLLGADGLALREGPPRAFYTCKPGYGLRRTPAGRITCTKRSDTYRMGYIRKLPKRAYAVPKSGKCPRTLTKVQTTYGNRYCAFPQFYCSTRAVTSAWMRARAAAAATTAAAAVSTAAAAAPVGTGGRE